MLRVRLPVCRHVWRTSIDRNAGNRSNWSHREYRSDQGWEYEYECDGSTDEPERFTRSPIASISSHLKRHCAILVGKIGFMSWIRVRFEYGSFNTVSIATDIRALDPVDRGRSHNVWGEVFDHPNETHLHSSACLAVLNDADAVVLPRLIDRSSINHGTTSSRIDERRRHIRWVDRRMRGYD